MDDIEKIVAETKAEIDADNNLHKCSLCVWHEDKFCRRKKKPVLSIYAPHCQDYLTNEQALRLLAIEEQKKAKKELARMHLKMDVMSYLISGALMEMESIDKELEDSYNRLKKKDAECERNHIESKRKRKRLIDAYKKMKYYMKNIDSEYRNYVEHYFSTIFGEEDGSYNIEEYEKNSVNSGVVLAFVNKFVDVSLENGENASSVFECMDKMQGSGLFTERDFGKCFIRK